MAEIRTYITTEDFNIKVLGEEVTNYLDYDQQLQVQKFEESNRIVIQALKDDSAWKKYLGMETSVTVELKQEDEILSVTIGNSKWVDKATVATVGAIFFAPLLITAGVGALKQTALPEVVFDYIEGKLLGRTSVRK
ncbi:hypothetical protein [Gemella cuniculi]|uniref:hypothetical protein n=1 Tax=Gemella cuniculi TaxID=150240 RepID=UPI0004299223|nr:hypothetical protein [Gemella cuniculi]